MKKSQSPLMMGATMFEWLEEEISRIKTPKFHVVDGAIDTNLRGAILLTGNAVPTAYKKFVLKFGNAKLYRRVRNDSYRIGVFASPRRTTLADGTQLYHLGFNDGASVYVKSTIDAPKFSIFEFEDRSERRMADSFEEWLAASCSRARRKYGKKAWAEIVRGPHPFTADEFEVINARRQIQWRVAGIDLQGNHIFEVENTGPRILNVLTVGIRSRDRSLNGTAYLKIAHIRPGHAAKIHADCFKSLVQPNEIEVFSLPDPVPEDRELYLELREIKRLNQKAEKNAGGEYGTDRMESRRLKRNL